jgi:hypothetical protein
MMFGNIADHRTDRLNPRGDVVFDPAVHVDCRRRGKALLRMG